MCIWLSNLKKDIRFTVELADFEDIDALGNIQINNAELELYAVTLPEDNSEWYPPIEQLISYQDNMEGSRSYGEDVRLALTENLLSVIFDGVISAPLAEDPNVRKYSMRVTAQMQDILNGETENLIIGSFCVEIIVHFYAAKIMESVQFA